MVKVQQIYTSCLAQAAYYIESNGEAAVVDPLRDPAPYLALVKKNNVKLKYVIETHFHADFVSGHVDLAKEAGATIIYGPSAMPHFSSRVCEDGEVLKIGGATITVLHTPGHTMESTTFYLKDEDAVPVAIFTGDTLFLGDVGRPDLAQKAANMTTDELARQLYRSLRTKIMTLPDRIIVYPGHGAGSACGKKLSSDTHTTLRKQLETNYALRANMTEDEFVKELTQGLPAPPEYFPHNVQLNKNVGAEFKTVKSKGFTKLSPSDMKGLLDTNVKSSDSPLLILDTRDAEDFVAESIFGTVFAGIDGKFAAWLGNAFPEVHTWRVAFIPKDPSRIQETVERLSRVGFDRLVGHLDGGFAAWKAVYPDRILRSNRITAVELANLMAKSGGRINVVDVRTTAEVAKGKWRGSKNVPLSGSGLLSFTNCEKDIYVYCGGGYRSLMFASALRSLYGYKGKVTDVRGGFSEKHGIADTPECKPFITTKPCPQSKL